jgi:hypothetical protein
MKMICYDQEETVIETVFSVGQGWIEVIDQSRAGVVSGQYRRKQEWPLAQRILFASDSVHGH